MFLPYTDLPCKIPGLMDGSGISQIVKPGKEVLIKIHPGEPTNYTYLHPVIVRKVVEHVKKLGGKPILTETTTLYKRERFTGKDLAKTVDYNGFTFAPFRVADQAGGVKVGGYEVAKDIYEAERMIVLTHVKGHIAAGYGGAIKQLGMGCLTKEGKRKVHEGTQPEVLDECVGCGACAGECPFENIQIKNKRAVVDHSLCCGCGACISACPNKAIVRKAKWREVFLKDLCGGAKAVLSTFEKGSLGFMNFMINITQSCDCASQSRIIAKDIGVCSSMDLAGVERECAGKLKEIPAIAKYAGIQADILGTLL